MYRMLLGENMVVNVKTSTSELYATLSFVFTSYLLLSTV